jgi:allophanate hydrolase
VAEVRPSDAVAGALDRIHADGRPGIWIEVLPRERVLAAAAQVEDRLAAGADLPLAGRTVAVKGNVDVAGLRTTAGCPSYGAVATRTAPAVRALEDAGAVVVGTTNLDQFATGLVGTRSPHGACPNAHWPHLVSGGSSSGSAVAVAAGMVDLGIGTDTAGSGRVPAAANGIVGLKPTFGRLSTSGVVPACASLDCVSVFARTVDLASEAVAVAGGFDPEDPWSRRPGAGPAHRGRTRLGVPGGADLVLTGAVTPARFTAAVQRLAAGAGADVGRVDLAPFLAAGELLYGGAFVAERYAAVGPFVEAGGPDLDPVVAAIIRAAGDLPAWQLARDRTELARLRRTTEAAWQDVDVLVVPTVPGLPTVAEVAADPVGANAALGRYTTFVNLLDLCALTVPVGGPVGDHPPVSLTLVAPAWADDALVAVASSLGAAS